MDLTRSSTAQKEDHAHAALLAHEDGKAPVAGARPDLAGTHLTIDLIGAQRLDDLAHIEATLKRCVDEAGARLLHIHLHRCLPYGSISGVALLAEGHISLHAWPHAANASLHVFLGGDAAPRQTIAALKRAFRPDKAVVRNYPRGARANKSADREKAQQAA
jgi:S-adenosylmethionine decarboxylase